MEVTSAQLLQVIGEQHVQIALLQGQIARLEAQLAAALAERPEAKAPEG